ncbi:MAG: ribosome biogenesis GTPase Der [Candidatus Gastranaerophilales bacterium]|nr:ribosome biogenesis GTPase Der [Candidatus Gastranaerophilales bacterium]
MAKKPIVAIIGRPNVGKSTFVNRLIGARHSIVDDAPGVTRDRKYFDVQWLDKIFTVIDTGGIVPSDEEDIPVNIFAQAKIACEEADKIIFMTDGKDGVTPIDEDIANILRRSGKPVYLAVNKIDSSERFAFAAEFYSLSLGEPYPISALHGSGGVGDLLDDITEDFDSNEDEEEDTENRPVRIAIVGKPNAGKSSIVNALLGKDRVIVSDVSGTTRDTIDSLVKYEKEDFILVDTAGIRKKAKVDWGIEKFAVARAIKAIRDCDVAVLVIDATDGLTDQDKKIASIVIEAGKGMIVAINKWDLIENKQSSTINKFEKEIEQQAPFLHYVPKIFISAVTKQRLVSIYKETKKVWEQCTKKVSTSLLNKVISDAYAMVPPDTIKNKRLKIYYTTQVKVCPPSFVFFVNKEELMKDSYKRYLENKLREAFGFYGTPIRLTVREKQEKEK